MGTRRPIRRPTNKYANFRWALNQSSPPSSSSNREPIPRNEIRRRVSKEASPTQSSPQVNRIRRAADGIKPFLKLYRTPFHLQCVQRHKLLLTEMDKAVRDSNTNFRNEQAAAEYLFHQVINQLREARKWAPTTTATNAGLLWGALARCGVVKSAAIKDALTEFDRIAEAFPSLFPWLIDPKIIQQMASDMMDSEETALAGLFMLVAIRGAFRGKDLLGASMFLEICPGTIAVYFQGKTGKAETTHISIHPFHHWEEALKKTTSYTEGQDQTKNPFVPTVLDAVRTALKTINPNATIRTIRSSAVVAMGLTGATMSQIQLLTHHASESMTLHYLRSGLFARNRLQDSIQVQHRVFEIPPQKLEMPSLPETMTTLNNLNTRFHNMITQDDENS